MGWLASLFGKKEKEDKLSDSLQNTRPAERLKQPASVSSSRRPETKSQARLKNSIARRASENSEINGWVNWNICGWVEVAGVQHNRDDAQWAFSRAKEGDVFDLKREPDNPYDPNAIKVSYAGRHVGYIERDLASLAAEKLPSDMPIRAEYISGYRGENGFVRLTIQPLMPDFKSRKEGGWEVSRQ